MSPRLRAASLLVVSGLVLALLALTALPDLTHQARVAPGGRALMRGLLVRAAAGDLALGPDTPPAWALGRAGQPDRLAAAGAAAFQQAADRLTQDGSSDRLAGIALGSLGQYRQAETLLAGAQAAQPDDPFASLALANVLDAQGQRPDARRIWERLQLVRPLALQFHRQGARLANVGRRDQAEAMLRLAIEIDPTFADPYHTLGGFYWGRDDQLAVQMYRKSLEAGGLEPFYTALARGKIALAEGRYADAATELAAAVQLRPDHGEANLFLGTALRQTGRPVQAIAYLQVAADLAPDSPWPLIQLGQTYLDLAEYQSASTALAAAIERQATQPIAFELLARAYAGSGRSAQAAGAWQQAIALRPDNVSYRVNLGDLLLQMGETEQALTVYQAALDIAPDNGYLLGQVERLQRGQ